MPLVPAPTIPYPDASGAQACADWCASTLAAARSRIVLDTAALATIHTWLMQRQWLIEGGGLASYPLPLASGPAVALRLFGALTNPAPPDLPSTVYGP